MSLEADEHITVTKALILKAISKGLSAKNLIVRLFKDQINGKEKFTDYVHSDRIK